MVKCICPECGNKHIIRTNFYLICGKCGLILSGDAPEFIQSYKIIYDLDKGIKIYKEMERNKNNKKYPQALKNFNSMDPNIKVVSK